MLSVKLWLISLTMAIAILVEPSHAAPRKIWTISPTEWNGVTQTPVCHDGHFFWDTVTQPFANREGVPIQIKKITIEVAGAAGLEGDYASRLWIQAMSGPSSTAISTGFEVYGSIMNDIPRRVFDFGNDYLPMAANEFLWFRWECGYFPQMGSHDNHQFFPGYIIEYVLAP